MAKQKEEKKIISFAEKAAELEKKYAKKKNVELIIPSGSVGYDMAIGGGYYGGRMYEYISWESGGKTTCALHAIAECQKMGKNAVYIDAEHALDRKYAERIGVDWEKMALFQPDWGEEGFEYAKEIISNGDASLLVIDSISGMLPKKQMEDPAGSSNLGLHARLVGTEIPKLNHIASHNNCVIILISQFREKIGVLFGSPETTQGGNSLKFWCSVRTELRKSLDKDGEEVNGINSKFKVVKNKIHPPYKTGIIPIKFGIGIDRIGEMISLGVENDVLKKWGDSITLLDNNARGETKYSLEEFTTLLKDNEEFYNTLRKQIFEKNGISYNL